MVFTRCGVCGPPGRLVVRVALVDVADVQRAGDVRDVGRRELLGQQRRPLDRAEERVALHVHGAGGAGAQPVGRALLQQGLEQRDGLGAQKLGEPAPAPALA